MNVALNRIIKDGPFGGGNIFLKLFSSFLKDGGNNVSFSINEDTSHVYIVENNEKLSSFHVEEIEKAKSDKNIVVVHRINENDARKGTKHVDSVVFENNRVADFSVFISNYLREYFHKKNMFFKNESVIFNGCDRNIYYPSKKIRKHNDPIKIITHHWSDNINKGFEIYRDLDLFCKNNPKFIFYYMGRYPSGYLKHSEIIGVKSYYEIPDVLRACDIYVSASKNEPGGYHVMEGLSCGLVPFVSNDSGGVLDYTGGFNTTFNNFDHLKFSLENIYDNYDTFVSMKNIANSFGYSSQEMCKKYLEVV